MADPLAPGQQIRIIDLPGAVELNRSINRPLEQSDVGFPDQDRSDAAMLKEITTNRQLSEGFIMGRGLVPQWDKIEVRMLPAYVEPQKWQGSNDQWRSSVGVPLIADAYYSMVSAFCQSLLGGYQPFMIEPTASTSLDAAKAQELLISAQLKLAGPTGSNAKQELTAIIDEGFLLGTGVGIMGWANRKIKRKMFRRKTPRADIPMGKGLSATVHANEDEIEPYFDEFEINQPIIEHVPLRQVRVAPDCNRGIIRTARWAGRLMYITAYELDSYRDCISIFGGEYNIPTREQLIALTTPRRVDGTNTNIAESGVIGGIGGSTPARPLGLGWLGQTGARAYPQSAIEMSNADPLGQPFEVFEYWTADRRVWVLEGQYVLLNEIHDLGMIPMVSFNFRRAPNSFFGYGMGFFMTDFQHLCQGIMNGFMDDLSMRLAGMYTSEKGFNIASQTISAWPGRIFKGEGADGLKPMTINSAVGNDPLAVVDKIRAMGTQSVGAGIGILGSNPGAPGDVRNPSGAQALMGGESTKLQDLIDQFCDLIFIPFLEFCVERNRNLKPSQIRAMLELASTDTQQNQGSTTSNKQEDLVNAFKADPINVLNGTYKVTISAGVKLRARQSLNASFGYIQTILQQPQLAEMLGVQGKKIDFEALTRVLFTSTGFPHEEKIIVDMTDEDKQRMAQSQAQGKLQADAQMLGLKTEAQMKRDDNQAMNRGLLATQKQMFQHSDKEIVGGLT